MMRPLTASTAARPTIKFRLAISVIPALHRCRCRGIFRPKHRSRLAAVPPIPALRWIRAAARRRRTRR